MIETKLKGHLSAVVIKRIVFGAMLALFGLTGCESDVPNAKHVTGGDGDADGDSDADGDADGDADTDTSDTSVHPGETDSVDVTDVCLGENPPMDLCKMVSSGPACGDGELNQASEQCDDGNTLPGDGCTGICNIEPNWICPTPGQPCIFQIVCGNGVLEAGEVCDDGNNVDDDGCSSACEQSLNYSCPVPGEACERVVFCGDGRINGEENCEDGNTASGDGCDADCKKEKGWACPVPGQPCVPGPRCGDGILSVGNDEDCDDGNANPNDGCDGTCKIESGWVCPVPGEACKNTTVCGDGRVTGQEGCDDANDDPTDGCDNCVLQKGYECPFPGAKCLADCGDGILMANLGEECDDGNDQNGDGCTSTCEWEDGFVCTGTPPNYVCRATICGDKVVEGTEACDDGNNNMGDGCTPFCKLEPTCEGGACTSICGDGLLLTSMGEVCDDGNQINGDGCSSDCKVEAGSECKQPDIGESMTVPIIVRDFRASHSDFEPDATGRNDAATGMVDDLLDAEGKPVFVGSPSEALVQSAASFAQWYRDVPGTNSTIPLELVLWDNGKGGYVNRSGENGEQWLTTGEVWCANDNPAELLGDCQFKYEAPDCDALRDEFIDCVVHGGAQYGVYVIDAYDGDPLFFPIDNHPDAITPTSEYSIAQIPGEYDRYESWPEDPSGKKHNFHFTSEVRYWFQYDATQTTPSSLEFTGDDDVWVFINNHLAVDLGGIHTPVNGSVTLDAAGATKFDLTDGEVYEIAVFQAERQTTSSTYRLTLSGFNAAESECGPICGDGVMSPGEQCDNGDAENTGEYGKCGTDCTRGPYCGDGIVQEEFEECDDGLNVSAYGTASTGCSPGCVRPATCGDGIVQPEFGEVCDDGVNDGSYDGCAPDCHGAPWCGDGQVNDSINPETDEPYEACDDGLNDGSYGTCAPGCVLGPRCGDGIVQEDWGEECDGSADCSPTCRFLGYCGDGEVNKEINPETGQPYEQCDDGINDGGFGECAAECKWGPYCGDGAVESSINPATGNPYELCDDRINDGGYGECAAGCVLGPRCGDGTVQPGFEECDFGEGQNGAPGVMCTTACKNIIIVPI